MDKGEWPMERTALFWALHQAQGPTWASLKAYLLHAPEREAWLFLRLLSGCYWYPRTPPHTLLKIAAHFTQLPQPLLFQCVQEAGDTAEALTLALIPPERAPTGFPENLTDWFLHQLPSLLRSEEYLAARLPPLWHTLSQQEAFFLHKVLLHSAHLSILRLSSHHLKKSSLLSSLLLLRWSLSESALLTYLRTSLEPPSGPSQPTLF